MGKGRGKGRGGSKEPEDEAKSVEEEPEPAQAFFGEMTAFDRISFVPCLCVLIIMGVMIANRGRFMDEIDRLEDALGRNIAWNAAWNQSEPKYVKDITTLTPLYSWADSVLFQKLCAYPSDGLAPTDPLPTYSSSAQEVFAKVNGAIRLADEGSVRISQIAMHQVRRQDYTSDGLTSDNFRFWTGIPASRSNNLSQAATIDLSLVPPFKYSSTASEWLARHKRQIDPVSAPGYFDSYSSAGYYAEANSQGKMHGYEYSLGMNPGYAAELLRTVPYCQSAVGETPCSLWVNGSTTMAIIIDFALLDPHAEKYESVTSCTIVIENPLDSKVFVSMECGNTGSVDPSLDIVLTVFLVAYFLVEVFSMRQLGWKYITNLWKILDVLQIVLLIVYIILRAGIALRTKQVLWDPNELTIDTVVKLSSVRRVSVTSIVIFGIASYLNVLKILRYMGFFPLLALPILTIVNAGWQLVSFAVLTIILLLAFGAMSYLVLAPFRVGAMSMGRSMLSMMQACIAGPEHSFFVRNLPPQYQWYANLSATFFRFFMYFIMLPIVIAIVSYAYNASKVGFKKILFDTDRLVQLFQKFRSRPMCSWFSKQAIQEMRRADEEFIKERQLELQEEKRKSLEGSLHFLALDLQKLSKSIEHASVRFSVLTNLAKHIETLETDYAMTNDVVLNCMQETSKHLERLVQERQTEQMLQQSYENPQDARPASRQGRGRYG